MISFANLLFVLLLILSSRKFIPGCSYEFNAVYVQREKSQYLLYYNKILSTHSITKIKENH